MNSKQKRSKTENELVPVGNGHDDQGERSMPNNKLDADDLAFLNVRDIAGRIKDLLRDGDQLAALVSLLREAPSTFTLTGLVYAMDGIRPNPGYEHLGDVAGVAPKIKRLMAEHDQLVSSVLLESSMDLTLVELADALTGTATK
jgi:hypothetical protein